MKNINEYITEGKKIVFSDCKGWSFGWIKIKDRWAHRLDPKMKYSLVCYPDDKSQDIVVFRNYAWYTLGYDQGHASAQKFYLNTIIGGGRGNGHGISKEEEPYDGDLINDADTLSDYLNKGKTYSEHTDERLEKAKITFPPKTKLSEIKSRIS